jgi:hypothetical protein
MRQLIRKMIVLTAVTATAMLGADSSLGTWKYNADKTKIMVGTNPLKSRTEVIEATPDGGFKITRTDQRTDGTTVNSTVTCKYDGNKCPVTGSPVVGSASYKRVNANTTTSESFKKSGETYQTGTTVVSKDGKTKTTTFKGVDAQDKPIAGTVVYDKQ